MGQILELTNLTKIVKLGITSPWVYSGVDKSWTRTNNPANQIDQELNGNRYLPKESFPDDISIRWKVGDIGSHQNAVGFSSWDGRWRASSENQPNLFGIVQSSGTTLNFFEFDAATPAAIGAGGLPGGLTLAVGDELRIQIHKVSNDYVLEYKWRRPPGGSEQIIRTSAKTNTQLISYLTTYDLYLRMTSTGSGVVTADVIKEVQMEVTDTGSQWLILPDELGTAENAPDDLTDGAITHLLSEAGEIPEETLPIPTEGQLFPLGDGREFVE